jgi:hypothetical protein
MGRTPVGWVVSSWASQLGLKCSTGTSRLRTGATIIDFYGPGLRTRMGQIIYIRSLRSLQVLVLP